MSDIIKNAFENIDPEAEKRLDEKLKNGSELFGLFDVSEWHHCQSEIEGSDICSPCGRDLKKFGKCKECAVGTDN
jgi:hypothetical protein